MSLEFHTQGILLAKAHFYMAPVFHLAAVNHRPFWVISLSFPPAISIDMALPLKYNCWDLLSYITFIKSVWGEGKMTKPCIFPVQKLWLTFFINMGKASFSFLVRYLNDRTNNIFKKNRSCFNYCYWAQHRCFSPNNLNFSVNTNFKGGIMCGFILTHQGILFIRFSVLSRRWGHITCILFWLYTMT